MGRNFYVVTIDTGAIKCSLKKYFAKSIDSGAVQTIEIVTISLADCSKRRIQNMLFTEVLFGHCGLNIVFLLMPDASENIILGMDFLWWSAATIICVLKVVAT